MSGWGESKQWLQKSKRLCWDMENRESISVQSNYYYQALAAVTETSLYWTLQEHWGHAGRDNTTSTLLFFLSFIKKKMLRPLCSGQVVSKDCNLEPKRGPWETLGWIHLSYTTLACGTCTIQFNQVCEYISYRERYIVPNAYLFFVSLYTHLHEPVNM